MFSLIKKGIHTLRPESCSLCPYGDGTHPPAKIGWDILDKEGKPLISRKRMASGSLLMLPDQVEADRIGGPRDAVVPVWFCEIRNYFQLPAVTLEPSVLVPPDPVGPRSVEVRLEGGTFEPATHFAWSLTNDARSPRLLDGWMPTHGDPAIPASFRTVSREPWRPPVAGVRPGPLHPIDQEIEVQLRAQPSAFPLQAALPVSVAEKLAWTGSGALPSDWRPAGRTFAAPEIRKHRPLYAAPPTPLPELRLPPPVRGNVSPYTAHNAIAGLQMREDRHLRNWTAAARTPAPRGQAPLSMPYAPLMRQRFRGWQGTPRSVDWQARDPRLAVNLPLAEASVPDVCAAQLPISATVAPERARPTAGPVLRWSGACEIALTRVSSHPAGFRRHGVAAPEIPD